MFENKAPIGAEVVEKENQSTEEPRIEMIGELDPRNITEQEFNQKSSLFHGTRDSDFKIDENFDYTQEIVDDSTLGSGLYTTADEKLAENYAKNRGGTAVRLMPFQARMLDLTAKDLPKNLSFPNELLTKWIDFAQPLILERVKSSKTKPEVRQRLIDILGKMNNLMLKDYIDLRADILGTDHAAFSVVDDTWREFCRMENLDGVVFVEGGDDETTRKNDRSYVFYNLNKIGTFQDWQRRRAE